jgi:hypothetical protein
MANHGHSAKTTAINAPKPFFEPLKVALFSWVVI